MEKALNSAVQSLENYYEQKKGLDKSSKEAMLTKSYFEWTDKKTNIIANEKSFNLPQNIEIKRGMVFWIDFGYNIDQEFGGRHPGIVLRVGGRTAIVIPATSQEPTKEDLNSGIYVEIDRIYNFKKMRRWVNVLNTTPISIQRFDFNSSIGNVKGYVLDKIKIGMNNSGLWK